MISIRLKGFLLSLLLHLAALLFLLNLSLTYTIKPKSYLIKKPAQLYIPSYTYTEPITPSTSHRHFTPASALVATPQTFSASMPSREKRDSTLPHSTPASPSIMNFSRDFLRQNQIRMAVKQLGHHDAPILLVGDKQAIVDPLTKLMGRSLSANFHYPKVEGTFGVTGRVYVSLVLHPEGFFSDVQIMRSSHNQNFDAAALYAVNTAPTVLGVDKFLNKPQQFVVGFIFN